MPATGSPKLWFSLSDIWPTVRLFGLMLLPELLKFLTEFDWTQYPDWKTALFAALVAFAARFLPDTRKVKP